jgi:hypothetical protein
VVDGEARACVRAGLDQDRAGWVDAQTTPYVTTLPPGRFLALVEARSSRPTPPRPKNAPAAVRDWLGDPFTPGELRHRVRVAPVLDAETVVPADR